MTRRSRTDRRAEALRFVGFFSVFYVIGSVVLATSFVERWIATPWTRANIAVAVAALHGIQIEAEAQGRTIRMADVELDVNHGCDGLGALLVLAAGMAGFPSTTRSKLFGFLLGAIGIFGVNAARLASLSWIAVHRRDSLSMFHVDVWQPLMMLTAFGLFALWAAWGRQPGPVSSRDA